MLRKLFLPASAVILFYLSPVWAVQVVPVNCDELLRANLLELAKQLSMTTHLSATTALPENNLTAQRFPYDQSLVILPFKDFGANHRIMISDVGTTIWHKEDLRKWYRLDASGILTNEEEAFRQMDRIRTDPSFCPEGLDEHLCRILRISEDARESAIDESYVGGSRDIFNPQHLRNLDEAHERLNAIRFPWGSDIRWPDQMAPHNALQVFRVLARETLLRRLIFKDTSGKTQLVGEVVDLETRLILASFPQLLPVLPLLPVMPLETEEMRIGSAIDPFFVLYLPFKFRGERIAALSSVPMIEHNPREVDISFSIDDDVATENFFAFEGILRKWIDESTQEFSRLSGLKAPRTEIEQNAMPGFDVKLKNASPQLQVLFIYFMKTRPLPPELERD